MAVGVNEERSDNDSGVSIVLVGTGHDTTLTVSDLDDNVQNVYPTCLKCLEFFYVSL